MNDKMLREQLKEKGYKLTNQREAILDVLLHNRGHIMTAEQIFEQAKVQYPQTNFSTIYRNLEILEKADIIHKMNVDGNAFQYELICHHEHHHHMICKYCGKSEPIEFCPLEAMKRELRDKSFTLTEHKFELYGICKRCIENNQK